MSDALRNFMKNGGWFGPLIHLAFTVVVGFILLSVAHANDQTFVRRDTFQEMVRRVQAGEDHAAKLDQTLQELSNALARLNGYLEREGVPARKPVNRSQNQ